MKRLILISFLACNFAFGYEMECDWVGPNLHLRVCENEEYICFINESASPNCLQKNKDNK